MQIEGRGEITMMLVYLVALQAASANPVVSPAAEPILAAPVTAPAAMVRLPQDTPVELMATAEVSTAKVTPGTTFKLRVNRAVEVDGRIIVPVGTAAFGEVITARDSGGLGKSGRMTARLLYMQLGEARIPLQGEMNAKGTGAGSAGLAILFSGWAGFFHRGNNAKIKAGEILAGFVSEDVMLDVSSGVARIARQEAAAPAASAAAP
jgi:hypothetical protein